MIPSGGHSYEGLQGLDCVTNLLADFVEAGSAKCLDTSCVAAIERPPFPTSPTRFRLVGSLSTYVLFDVEDGRGSRLTVEESGVGGLG